MIYIDIIHLLSSYLFHIYIISILWMRYYKCRFFKWQSTIFRVNSSPLSLHLLHAHEFSSTAVPGGSPILSSESSTPSRIAIDNASFIISRKESLTFRTVFCLDSCVTWVQWPTTCRNELVIGNKTSKLFCLSYNSQ